MLSLTFLLPVLTAAVWGMRDYTGHRIVSITATSKDQLEVLHRLQQDDAFDQLDFWTELSLIRAVDIHVAPEDYERLATFLADNKIRHIVVNKNLQQLVEEEFSSMAKASRVSGCDVAATYCNYAEIEAWLFDMEAKFPSQIELTQIGTTHENQAIYSAKVAADVNTHKDSVWIEAGTHAREWIAISSALNLIEKLVDGSSMSADMLDKYDWNIVAVHNPDGYIYTHSTSRYHRKNRQPPAYSTTCSSNMGTDLNRNWNIAFGQAGTSSSCSQNTYHGGEAFSAQETAALSDAVSADHTAFAFFSIHCYSELMLVPYGYTSTKPADYTNLEAVADHMMAYLENERGKYYRVGTPPDILYAASGGAYDYFYEVVGLKYSYTYELSPANTNQGLSGFNIAASNISPVSNEVFRSLWAFATLNL